MELSEKINSIDRDLLQRMTNLKELPDFLLEEYFRVKRLVDKVDARINPTQLAEIVLRCGFNSETMKFQDEVLPYSPPVPTIDVPLNPTSTPPGMFVVGETVQFMEDEQIMCGRVAGCRLEKGERVYTIEGDDDETHDLKESELEVL